MIRFGIIGRNFIVDNMLAAMAAVPEVQPVAVYSRSADNAQSFADANGLPYAFSDLNALAECPEVDAVYIASPNYCHFSQAQFLLNHGKHVLCEKPAASNSVQVRDLVKLAQEKDLIFLEAMRPVFADPLRVIRETLPEIGTLRQVRFDYCKTSSRFKLFLEKGSAVNAFNPELDNAAVMDLGCYGVHSIIHLFGRPDAVSAQSFHLDNGFEGGGTVLMRYPGFTTEVSYSKVTQLDLPSFLLGEKGTIWLDCINNTNRMWLTKADGTERDLGIQAPQPSDMVCELRAFADFVRDGIQPLKHNEDSILTSEVLDEARKQTGTSFPSDFTTLFKKMQDWSGSGDTK